MSPKSLRMPVLGACLVALALVVAPLGIAADTDDEFDVAARAEVGKQGREVQLASRAHINQNGRNAMKLAARAQIDKNGWAQAQLLAGTGLMPA